ncbi:MAG: hypothetical protein Q8N78_07525, partial [Sulfurimonas sp.]|nr:hypothetical protein [Sulfurimonas sp.]
SSENPTVTDENKKHIQGLKENLSIDDKEVEYNIEIDGQPQKQTLLQIFGFIFGIFLPKIVLSDEDLRAALLKQYDAEFGGTDCKDSVAEFVKRADKMKSSERKLG